MQVNERLWIDEDANAIELVNPIALPRLAVEADVIAEPGTAAALYSDAQSTLLRRHVLLRHGGANLAESALRDLNALNIRRGVARGQHWAGDERAHACFDSTSTGAAVACFFFQSPIAARIASSASTEQWIFTGGNASSFTMSVFLMAKASSTVLPFTHSVARDEEAIAEPQPNVLNLASSMTCVSEFTLICRRITSPHSGAPTRPVPTSLLLLSIEPTFRGLV